MALGLLLKTSLNAVVNLLDLLECSLLVRLDVRKIPPPNYRPDFSLADKLLWMEKGRALCSLRGKKCSCSHCLAMAYPSEINPTEAAFCLSDFKAQSM